MRKFDVCLYHDDCLDGFGASFLVDKVHSLGFKAAIESIPVRYGQEPPWDRLQDRNIIIVDFSYPKATLMDMIAQSKSLVLLDHHADAYESIKDLQAWAREHYPDRHVKIDYDADHSGMYMTWSYYRNALSRFNPDKPPGMVILIEDHDLGKMELEDTPAFLAGLRSLPRDYGAWNPAYYKPQQFIAQGQGVLSYIDQTVIDIARHAIPDFSIGGVNMPICNAPHLYAGQVCTWLRKTYNTHVACSWFMTDKGQYRFSLRSDEEFDCSKFAMQFGGKGHAKAAGFILQQWPRS